MGLSLADVTRIRLARWMVRAAAAILLSVLAVGCWDSAEPVGGGWYYGERASTSMDDKGAKGMLYREIGGERIAVGRDVYEYRFYPPDCIVWMTGRTLFGGCGDRRPVAVASAGSLDWALLPDRADFLGHFSVLGGRKPPERPQFILIDSIRAVAERQPALDTAYQALRQGEVDYDSSLTPTLGRPDIPDLEARDHYGETKLFEAVRHRNQERIEMLLAAGANVNARNNPGATPLIALAYDYNRTDTLVIAQLVAAGADVNLRDENGWTALIRAVNDSRAPVVAKLIAVGADVNAFDNEGKSVLSHANRRGNAEIIGLITQAGGRP
jgi:hypothetical protein